MTFSIKFTRNVFYSLVLSLTWRAAGALIFIAIARFGNIRDAGTFSLALGYLAILNTVLTGLDDILIRECVRSPSRVPSILITFGVIRFALTLVVWITLSVILGALSLYSPNDLTILAVLTSSILMDCFTGLAQAVLIARGNFALPLVAVMAGTACKFIAALAAVIEKQGLFTLSVVWLIGSALTAILMVTALALVLRESKNWDSLHFERDLAFSFLRLFPSFGFANLLSALEFQIDIILLSVLLTNEAIAEYSAMVTIVSVLQMFTQAVRSVFFPVMVRSLNDRSADSRKLIQRSLWLMLGLSLVASTGVFFTAKELVDLIYGVRFASAVPILQILIWNIIFLFLDVPLVRFLMAGNHQTVVWQTSLVTLTINVTANLLLIPGLGSIGPAYARLLSSGLFCLLIGWQVFRKLGKRQVQTIRDP